MTGGAEKPLMTTEMMLNIVKWLLNIKANSFQTNNYTMISQYNDSDNITYALKIVNLDQNYFQQTNHLLTIKSDDLEMGFVR